MTASDVGRNDPCPCGSGKKYKYCCLRKDQERRRRRSEAPSSFSPADHPVGGLLQQVRRLTENLRNVPGEEARGLEEQADWLERMVVRWVEEHEIDAAMEILEAHRDEFQEMIADPVEAMDRAMRLFSEERFADLRVSTDELQQAFDAVGYPTLDPRGSNDEDADILMNAAIHLAGDEEARAETARRLLGALPEMVAANRFMDGWLIQHSAYCLLELPDRNNPFMFVIVQLALKAWVRETESKRRSMMEELGVDISVLRGSTLDEVRALGQELGRDPDKRAHLERLYAEHPVLQRQAEQWMKQLERDVVKLLEREDAQCLLLSPQQIKPWLIDFVERTEALQVPVGASSEAGNRQENDMIEAARDAVRTLTLEMSAIMHNSGWVDELIEALREYVRRLEDAGEEEAARWANNALTVAQWDLPPTENPVLLGISYVSLREAVGSLVEGGADPGA